MMQWHSLNLDYEYSLYQSDLTLSKRDRICAEFEYLLYYAPLDGGVSLHLPLESVFLSQVPFSHPTVLKHKDAISYWGALKNVELEQKLNSKIFSTQLADHLNINVSNKVICHDLDQLQAYQRANSDCLVFFQPPYLFSGIGQGVLEDRPYRGEFPVVCSRALNRIVDLGTVFTERGQIIRYINLVNRNGVYKGTIILPESEMNMLISKLVEQPYPIVEQTMNMLDKELLEVDQCVRDEGGEAIRQYDSFLYLDPYLKVNSFVELNYRRSMGQLFYEIAKVRENKYFVFWIDKSGVTSLDGGELLSPKRLTFSVFCKSTNDFNQLYNDIVYLKTTL